MSTLEIFSEGVILLQRLRRCQIFKPANDEITYLINDSASLRSHKRANKFV